MSRRVFAVAFAASILLNVAALGWLTWIVADPSYWFPGAYAEQGEQGPPGPPGARGPVGPEGPVGPDAETAVEELGAEISGVSGRVDDLETAVDELGQGISSTELQSQVDQLSDEVETLSGKVETLCSGISEVTDYVYGC